ncbi:MAG: metallopeptidase TldD-related protein [Candidatus Solibacter sp.]
MKTSWLKYTAGGLFALTALGILGAQAQQEPADPMFQAMRDEIDRARKLALANLEAPYFVEFTVDEEESFSVSANLGGLLGRRRERFRSPSVDIRVGDYKFDNGNYVGSGVGFGTRYDLGRFPLEDSYPLLRRYFWLLTDSAYKSSVEAISRKRAAMRNLQQGEQLNDFAHADPVKSVRPIRRLTVDEEQWAGRVRALSAIFAEYPDVKNSAVELEISEGGLHLVNSEGTETREPESAALLRARAVAQAPDGMTLRDAATFHAHDAAHLPSDAELRRGISEMAQNVVALSKAPRGEDYSGPVLFEGQAGAQVFAEVLSRNLTLTRRPVGEGAGRGGGGTQNSELDGRMGARVLPDTFDVVDDPTQTEWRGRPLFGSYHVDREGVVPKPLRLIEKGVLKSYLLTRQPVRGFEGSNGRARLPGSFGTSAATVSNLFISATDSVPAAELKKKLIELCRTRNKPYGIIVRRMDFPSTAGLDEVRRLVGGQQGGRPVSMPILVYKVYVDGREELVRGLRFRGFNVRSLKDILASGDDSAVFEYMDNTAPFALVGGAGFTAETCVIAPSILIDDLELHPAEEESPKLPVVSPPDMTR